MPEEEQLRTLHFELSRATKAAQNHERDKLATVHSTVQPIVDAFMAWVCEEERARNRLDQRFRDIAAYAVSEALKVEGIPLKGADDKLLARFAEIDAMESQRDEALENLSTVKGERDEWQTHSEDMVVQRDSALELGNKIADKLQTARSQLAAAEARIGEMVKIAGGTGEIDRILAFECDVVEARPATTGTGDDDGGTGEGRTPDPDCPGCLGTGTYYHENVDYECSCWICQPRHTGSGACEAASGIHEAHKLYAVGIADKPTTGTGDDDGGTGEGLFPESSPHPRCTRPNCEEHEFPGMHGCMACCRLRDEDRRTEATIAQPATGGEVCGELNPFDGGDCITCAHHHDTSWVPCRTCTSEGLDNHWEPAQPATGGEGEES